MKKAVLLSVFMLNLAFGVDYQSMLERCKSGFEGCEELFALCNDKNDGKACNISATVFINAAVFSYKKGDMKSAQILFEEGKQFLSRGCYKLKNQECCISLKEIQSMSSK